jgi:hypothetical protein
VEMKYSLCLGMLSYFDLVWKLRNLCFVLRFSTHFNIQEFTKRMANNFHRCILFFCSAEFLWLPSYEQIHVSLSAEFLFPILYFWNIDLIQKDYQQVGSSLDTLCSYTNISRTAELIMFLISFHFWNSQ